MCGLIVRFNCWTANIASYRSIDIQFRLYQLCLQTEVDLGDPPLEFGEDLFGLIDGVVVGEALRFVFLFEPLVRDVVFQFFVHVAVAAAIASERHR